MAHHFNPEAGKAPNSTTVDQQIDNPEHYTALDPEPWEVVYNWFGAPGCLSHVVKYVARAGRKSSNSMLCDLRKARNWLDHLIGKLEGR